MDIVQELMKLGPPGLICVLLYIALYKSEQREKAKDMRIQLLENQLIESYGERIEASDRIANAIHANANIMQNVIETLRSKK